MIRIKRFFGMLGIAAAVVLMGAAITAIVCGNDGFTPLNAFYNELGLFSGGYFVPSFALLFNLSFVLFGLVFGALMVIDALAKNTASSTALGFFGALTGVLAMAQGLFTLNFSQYHYMASIAFFISVFVLCALYVVVKLTERGKKPVLSIVAAVCTCAAGAAYAWYMLSGGMSAFFVEDASLTSRAELVPFAPVGWVALALFLAFAVLYSIAMIGFRRKKADAPEIFETDESEDQNIADVLDDITDEELEESVGHGLERSPEESTEDDDSLYGL